jgi:hypothetical protein
MDNLIFGAFAKIIYKNVHLRYSMFRVCPHEYNSKSVEMILSKYDRPIRASYLKLPPYSDFGKG